MALQTVGIIGGGAWGTALAMTARLAGRDALIWAYEASTVEDINKLHVNRTFLPGVPLDPAIEATSHLNEVASADLLLLVAPSQAVRGIAAELAQFARSDQPLVICSKGFEQSTGKLLSDVVSEELPEASLAVLSGPSFAAEIARGLPAAVTLGAPDKDQGAALSRALSHAPFRCYWSEDMVGVQIGGAVKNVYAIAAGIVTGKQLGASAHAALVARSFAELVRFGAMFGAKRETLAGLSGLGDLVLTCGSPQSRNMSLGLALGQGRSLAETLKGRQSVTEGIYTARALAELAQSRGIEMPIASAVNAVATGRATVDQAIEALLSRPLRAEV
jgi:glycerol-3-phosphate dehydrogenase (NAD(P)+)